MNPTKDELAYPTSPQIFSGAKIPELMPRVSFSPTMNQGSGVQEVPCQLLACIRAAQGHQHTFRLH
jgi:hypothetical protein